MGGGFENFLKRKEQKKIEFSYDDDSDDYDTFGKSDNVANHHFSFKPNPIKQNSSKINFIKRYVN